MLKVALNVRPCITSEMCFKSVTDKFVVILSSAFYSVQYLQTHLCHIAV